MEKSIEYAIDLIEQIAEEIPLGNCSQEEAVEACKEAAAILRVLVDNTLFGDESFAFDLKQAKIRIKELEGALKEIVEISSIRLGK